MLAIRKIGTSCANRRNDAKKYEEKDMKRMWTTSLGSLKGFQQLVRTLLFWDHHLRGRACPDD